VNKQRIFAVQKRKKNKHRDRLVLIEMVEKCAHLEARHCVSLATNVGLVQCLFVFLLTNKLQISVFS
jgi:hypothetical protein